MTDNNISKKRIFLIDGYALLFRAHFALIRNPLITSYGLNTSALFGFLNQILKLIKDENPDYIVCAFDSKGKTFRHELYENYKANRPEMPEELQLQLPHLWGILEKMNMSVIKKVGYEADDIIGTLADQAQGNNLISYIVSGDKDFMQLINDEIFLYAPGTKKTPYPIIYDCEKVEKKWGVPPEKIIDLLGLMGDSSDNVPGVAGVGQKTAVKLIKEFGSLEGALKNALLVKNKRAQTGLLNGSVNAKLSKELVTIIKDVNLDYQITDFDIKTININACIEKFSELEFHALLKQFGELDNGNKLSKQIETQKQYGIIKTTVDLDNLLKKLNRAKIIALGIQTTNLKPMEAEIIGISISTNEHEAWYIPIQYPEKKKNNFEDNDLDVVLIKLKNILEDKSKLKTAKDCKYIAQIFIRYGIKIEGLHFDTTIAAHLLNPVGRTISLNSLSLEYLNYEMKSIDELIGKGQKQIPLFEVPLDKIAFYSSEEVDITLQLTNLLNKKLEEGGMSKYFYEIEMKLLFVLIQMEYEGVFVDSKLLIDMSNKLGQKIKQLTSSIYLLAGEEFNINSTQQLSTILFDVIKLPQIKKRSTAENVLRKLVNMHDMPKLILDYRKYNKLKNTYLDSLPELINQSTDRIHSFFNQTIAATGRLTSSNPNFQNIPIRTEQGKEIRKAFKSQNKGWKIFSFDYSQIELRIMAHYSQDKGLIKAFEQNEDVHSRTASTIFEVPLGMITNEMRRTAKVVNFGIMYGAGSFRMSQELGIPIKEATRIIDMYYNQFSGIKNYIEITLEKARKYNFVETICGRKRYVWDINSSNAIRRKAAERMAINMPIQGSAAEMIKLAMIDIMSELSKEGFDSKLILQIHDELIFEYPEHEEKNLSEMVVQKMENALKISVPIIVDYGNGESWFEAH